MSLTAEDLAAIEAIVRGILKPTALVPGAQWLPRRLCLPEFAAVLEVDHETARRYLRANKHGIVSKKFAINDGRWMVDIAALPLFGVTPALASARLAQMRAPQAPTTTPLPSSQLVPA